MNNDEQNGDRIPTADPQATLIEYCGEHYSELITALLDRQLAQDISGSQAELRNKLENGESDAGLEAASAITSAAISLFGPEAILQASGCPLCTFQHIVTHVADHLAVKYRESN